MAEGRRKDQTQLALTVGHLMSRIGQRLLRGSKMTDTIRKLTYVSPDEINPNRKNPRKHSAAQIRALAKSIQAFGFNVPMVVDRDMQVLAGHGRLLAARQLKLTLVPVICVDDLSEAEANAYMLADNKLTDRSTWDEPLLAAHLKELSALSADFDLEATGFEPPEIDLRILSLDEDKLDPAEDFEGPKRPPVTKPGDCWLLNDHVICCGNALDPSTYALFPDAAKAAAVFTDPPYNVPIEGHVSGRGKIKHHEFFQASGEMTRPEFTAFLTQVLGHAKAKTQAGALLYCCMDWRHLAEMQAAGEACDLELINFCVWVKSNGGMGTLYRSRHELVFVFKNGGGPHCNNVQLGRFGRNRTNVWHYPGANVPGAGKLLHYHPTPKPIAMVADALQDATARGDYVLDPFLGSGTTLLAAERTGRKALGIDLDPVFIDTAIARWQKMTGSEARLANGQPFSAVVGERSAV
jgi:DNA modification methylase